MSHAPTLPPSLAELVAGAPWHRVLDGESGGAVFRLDAPDATPLYLKHGTGSVADDIVAEFARLEWLAGRLAVPRVVHFARQHDAAWLLTTALPGRTAYDALVEADDVERAAIVGAIADFVRALHAIPTVECPFEAGHTLRLAQARRRVDAGVVDVTDFDAERQGWSAEQVWAATTAMLPLPFARVVTHGDCSLGNLCIADGRVTGCLDVGRAGVADPYQDLAILWHNLAEFGPALQRRLFEAYGEPVPDLRRIAFHLALDEL